MRRRFVVASALLVAAAAAGVAYALEGSSRSASGVPAPPFAPTAVHAQARVVFGRRPGTGRYEYLVLDGRIDVYREGSAKLVQRISIASMKTGVRGLGVDTRHHLLYISFGGDGGAHGAGSLLKYDLLRDRIVWEKRYPIGIDSFALTPDGRTIFMPGGEAEAAPFWYVLRASDGRAVARIDGGAYAHNTIVSLDGRRVYMGPRGDEFLTVADAHTYAVIRKIAPLRNGVRPFTINAEQTLAFTTASSFRGFQVGSIATGKVLYTVDFGRVPSSFTLSAPSHGVSLSPDEKQLWVLDSPAARVRVFDVTGLPARAPRQIAALPIPAATGNESLCAYDCERSGWVQHTLDGKYVYVGDSGSVFATDPPRLAFRLRALRDTRKHIEIDWRGGLPVATSTREGLGRRPLRP
jgi:hypothetical protein